MRKLSSDSTKVCSDRGEKVLIGIRLTLPKTFESPFQAADYIQDHYFDELGSSGFFRLLPEKHKQLATAEYLHCTTPVEESILESSIENQEGYSVVEMLLGQYDFEEGVDKVLECTSAELDEFVAAGFATHWRQFPLH